MLMAVHASAFVQVRDGELHDSSEKGNYKRVVSQSWGLLGNAGVFVRLWLVDHC